MSGTPRSRSRVRGRVVARYDAMVPHTAAGKGADVAQPCPHVFRRTIQSPSAGPELREGEQQPGLAGHDQFRLATLARPEDRLGRASRGGMARDLHPRPRPPGTLGHVFQPLQRIEPGVLARDRARADQQHVQPLRPEFQPQLLRVGRHGELRGRIGPDPAGGRLGRQRADVHHVAPLREQVRHAPPGCSAPGRSGSTPSGRGTARAWCRAPCRASSGRRCSPARPGGRSARTPGRTAGRRLPAG